MSLKKRPGIDCDKSLTSTEALKIDLYEWAKNSVESLYKMLDKQAQIHSGKKYGNLDIFGTALQLQMGVKLTDFDDPLAAYALSLDMMEFQLANSGFNAVEYAGMAISSEKLKQLLENKNRSELVLHVMKGIIEIFKQVMSVGSSGKTWLLDGLTDEQKAMVMISSGSDDIDHDGSINAPDNSIGDIVAFTKPAALSNMPRQTSYDGAPLSA